MTLPSFPEFFLALQDTDPLYEPFPWQKRLARQVVSGGWPSQIGVPTGLGKTTCLDIGVWAMAVSSEASTRLWYVVNRRLLVDAARERALLLQRRLSEATDGPLLAVADALRARAALGVDGGGSGLPLQVVRLRGGVPQDASAPDPSQPALLLATVPMYASRLLFRGYGLSRGMRPIAAAHAGVDATVLLDEAHLSRPLTDLQRPLVECDPGDPRRVLGEPRARARLVSLTATGDDDGDRFELDDEDHADQVVQRRLQASKPTRLIETKERQLAKTLATAAVDLLVGDDGGSTVVVFVNTARLAPAVVTEVHAALGRSSLEAQVEFLTGRLRSSDAQAVRDRLLLGTAAVASGWEGPRDRPLVVVATQTLEVGADLDFEHLVTECAGVRALVQRFGRLNRLGTRNEVTSAVVVHAADRREHPVYGEEVPGVWERLAAAVDAGPDGTVDLGQRGLELLGQPDDAPDRVPSLLPHHLWEWTKTSLPQQPATPVEPFFSGIDDTTPTVNVFWRWWVPPPGTPVQPPPDRDEVLELPLWDVRSFLEAREARGDATAAGRWARVGAEELEAASVVPRALRPGDTLVLSTELGGYTPESGWDPDGTEPVEDLSLGAGFLPLLPESAGQVRLPPGFAMDPATTDELARAFGRVRTAARASVEEQEQLGDVETLLAFAVERFTEQADGSPLKGVASAWKRRPSLRMVGGTPVVVPAPATRSQTWVDVRLDAFDDLSFDQTSTALEHHLGSVGAAAKCIAERLGLPGDLVRSVELAGALHDVGKADRRFQRVLDPDGVADKLLAKSSPGSGVGTRARPSGWPRGGRHEALSGRAVLAWFKSGAAVPDVDRDLVVHLVVSHHGHGRPLVPPVRRDDLATIVQVPIGGGSVEIEGDLSVHDWDQPARFRMLCQRYGTWGLALLESIVRQADHAASAAARRGGAE